MNWTLFRNMMMTAGVVLAVAGCGGGGDTVASGGTGGTGISSGPVTGFGSVFVNDVEFDTTTSSVTIDGAPDDGTDPHRGLKVGMVVKVDGEFADDGIHGTATEIEYKDNVEGPVDSITPTIDPTINRAVVLGQTVILDKTQTHFENTTFDTLAQGDFVEVSGLVDDAGQIRATYVEVKTPGEMEVKGTIKNLDMQAKTFKINALIVDYSSTNTSDLPGGVPADGQYVEVKGMTYSGGTLTATEVEMDDDTLGAADAGKVEMEGYVTDVTPPSQFTVGTQAVQTTSSTVFENGTASNIVKGSKVEVEGPLAGGVLTATKVSFH